MIKLIVPIIFVAFAAVLYQPFISWWQLAESAQNTVSKDLVVLHADHHDGKDEVWERRYYYGKRTWGIRGSGTPETGKIWFDHFPGESGTYSLRLDTVLEHDGRPAIAVLADETTLVQLKFPYFEGTHDCAKRGGPGSIELGTFRIEKGQRITLVGSSVYECGKNGAYGLWDALSFTRLP